MSLAAMDEQGWRNYLATKGPVAVRCALTAPWSLILPRADVARARQSAQCHDLRLAQRKPDASTR